MALAEILARKRHDVAARMTQTPLETFQDRLKPSDRPFGPPGCTAFILECKRASPSEGVLRAALDVDGVALTYAPFATAISVLTDEPFFHGSFADLARIRGLVTQPVLCKDFVLEPYQIYEARLHGADMVLLMLSVLEDRAYQACAEVATRLRMTILTEVHDAAELARARGLQAQLVGINNRNLKTLEVDLRVSDQLLPAVPPGVVRISESGISTHAQARHLRSVGCDGFLVGSALMKSSRLDRAVRQLIYGNVKVCGLRRPEDAAAAWAAGATWGGLIFAPASPRAVTMEQARNLRDNCLHWVGVFVDAPLDQVAGVATELQLDAVQLHGQEDPDYLAALRPLLPAGCEIWKAYRVQSTLPETLPTGVDRLLLDTWSADRAGGTGARWDWQLLAACRWRERVVLSGGLTPELAEQADATGVWGLDVNSGVESSPGVKDAERLSAFFAPLRGVSA